jgi:hypothetical protein
MYLLVRLFNLLTIMVALMKAKAKSLAYCGVGSRETPTDVCDFMRGIASTLAQRYWMLRSGHADGADIAFEEGCISAGGTKEIYVPWQGFHKARHGYEGAYAVHCLKNHLQALDIAAQTHPNWKACSNAAQMLHTRNVYQIMGLGLNTPADMVICWTKDGNATGGTGQAIRLAQQLTIPIFNLFHADVIDKLQDFVYKTEVE